MKVHVTRKQARALYPRIIRAGYCSLQLVLEREAVGYNAGLYGWNWDLIPVSVSVAVCTGYRGMVGEDMPGEVWRTISECESIANDFRGHTDAERNAAQAKAREVFAEYVKSLEA